MSVVLDFEKPIVEIQKKIDELKKMSEDSGLNMESQIQTFEQQAEDYKKELYSKLKPSQKLQIARHQERPKFLDYVHLICEDFIELHGDREGMDDRAIIGGLAKIDGKPVMIIGIQKGKTTKENLEYNFGMPQPQGYRKALRLFKHANKFNIPVVTLIDTPGAYPGIKAEETGQGAAIAVNLREMSKLNVPIVAIITGEGCSGGALGLAVADRVMMLEHAYYTVISPEGCASILWRDAAMFAEAAEALKITSTDLLNLGIIDEEIKEPLGGAHADYDTTAKNMKNFVLGANIKDKHIVGANLEDGIEFVDISLVKEGEYCPECGKPLFVTRGIEVGNIFQLGTKYSKPMGATYTDEQGQLKPYIMGCYGIGVSRTMAAAIEKYHDDFGIVWPIQIAPYHVDIVPVNVDDELQSKTAYEIYNKLIEQGIEAVIDDRADRAGVKFKDADLIGFPVRITVGKTINEGLVEYKTRANGQMVKITPQEAIENVLEYVKKSS